MVTGNYSEYGMAVTKEERNFNRFQIHHQKE